MKTIYWVNTNKFCGAIAVKKGAVYAKDTAPCFRWMSGKQWYQMLQYLKRNKYLINCVKLAVEEDD
jgi:hypothetical protein